MPESQLPTSWQVSLPFETCNFHWRRQAVYSYCGTPMCERCAEAGGLPVTFLQSRVTEDERAGRFFKVA